MVTKASAAPAAAKDTVVSTAGDTDLVLRQKVDDTGQVQKGGERGPPSSLETGIGSTTGASAGGAANFEGNNVVASEGKAQSYSVQMHDDENGLQVKYVTARSGDEAAQKVLAGAQYKGVSIRGVTPASDPDPNSLGGERDASIMIANGENPLGIAGADPLGTEANRKATRELAKGDIEELGE